ncbi:MAG: hypothetical protein JST29_05520 [Bacteroidetes bacterium]|nr:hypothetical protein [Bacteroidota bacterium]
MIKDVLKSKDPVMRYISYGIVIIVIIAIITIIVKVFKASQTGANAAGDIAGSQMVAAQTGISPDRQQVCKQVAKDVRSAMTVIVFTNYVWNMNDNAVVLALNRLVTANEALLASQYFKENNGFSWAEPIINDNWYDAKFRSQAKVNPIVLNNLV